MEPIEYRRAPGRPGKDEPSAPTVRLQTRIPKAVMTEFLRIAKNRGLSRQAAVREAMSEWMQRYDKAP